uniref:hypothetical protein n=1 Tax=Cupriavidus taiwanensis TaxID=164546 RepID=UPI003F496851
MDKAYFSHWRKDARPCREQNLFIGLCKHVYLLKDGTLKYQKKPLDPRDVGKDLITHFVLLDVDTGIVYGECHTEESRDLAGFFARAWSSKPEHPMRGIPTLLNVPKVALSTEAYREDLARLQQVLSLDIGDLPGGFSAGIHAVKAFDKRVEALVWRCSMDDCAADIHMAQAFSALLSAEACSGMSHTWHEQWADVPSPTGEFFAAVDDLYETRGAWREGAFKFVLDGIPRHHAK